MDNNTNPTQPIFRWNGQYYGFMANGYLIDSSGTYRGWIDHDGTVWQSNKNSSATLSAASMCCFINQRGVRLSRNASHPPR